jgi:tRNA(Ile)-lysidine synthase
METQLLYYLKKIVPLSPMIQKVGKYIEEHGLLDYPSSKIIVGLSGGADSVVLLYILRQLGYQCVAAHCNFHLRGEESQRDEKSAGDFAASFNIPFFKQDFDTESVAQEKGISIEMAARDLRYEWFEQLRKEENAATIAVAHHRDDSVETMLLNLIRGTGIKGLTGIKPKNGTVIRPLLCLSKKEILLFATEKKLPYILDSSNLQDEYTRNKIRLSVLPLLRSINPSIETSLLRTMENLNEVEKIYDYFIEESEANVFNPEKGTIDIAGLQTLPSPESVLFELLKKYGFGRDCIQDIARVPQRQSGKEFHSPEYTLLKDRKQFFLLPREQKSEKNVYWIDRQDLIFEDFHKNFEIIKDKNFAYFDADKLQFPLQVRKWEKGDKFIPFGMNGFQKLSDYFNNHKFSKPEKENTRLLCSGNDIIWIIGHRTDDRYKVNQETKKVCILKLF